MIDLDLISHDDLLTAAEHPHIAAKIERALLTNGIIGIQYVPAFEQKTENFIAAARAFSALPEKSKQQYTPDRDAGITEGYELGAEWFKDNKGEWQIDDKKASFYAYVPEQPVNQWPREIDLQTAYVALGELIFATGKKVLNALGLNEHLGLDHSALVGYGRMLHYCKEEDARSPNPNWCGAHFDHSLLTGLVPAYYFCGDTAVDEPEESGLYITPHEGREFEKIDAANKSVLLFQVGEFAQLLSNDRIRATKHLVKKATNTIERFTFALFISPSDEMTIQSTSVLTADARYATRQSKTGSLSYKDWSNASFERYRAVTSRE